jgi:asparagine synthase (glutamine-hydrolysing)
MCGILGGWWRHASQDLEHRADRALELMRNRGPNDQGREMHPGPWGVCLAGHTRLSILDLSAAGHQPMASQDGRYLLVFNGEIYNYRELREELKARGVSFHSDSDTEVLLQAWMTWGPAVLPRLVGMFAFGMLDKHEQTWTLVRDPFGIKPLLYTHDADHLIFASEPASLYALQPAGPKLDWQTAYDYLVHGHYDHRPSTFVRSVRQMPPAHMQVLSLRDGSTAGPTQWWTPDITPRQPAPRFEDAAQELRELFLQSIRLHLRSDVPLGAALSGGLDSSAIVCAIRHIEPDMPLHTFSFISPDAARSEEKWVDIVNQHVGAIEHKVRVDANELATDLDDMIKAQAEPFGSTSIYAQYRVFQEARRHGITVMLEGQGADELLAGYNGYPGHRARSLIQTGHWIRAAKFIRAQNNWPGRSARNAMQETIGQLLPESLYETARGWSGRESAPSWIDSDKLQQAGVVMRHPRVRWPGAQRGRCVMGELAMALTRRGMPPLLRHGDRNSMRFSIESRVPFLIRDMADYLLSLPEDYLVSDAGQTKHVLRTALRGIVPDSILVRKDKIGFETPELAWLSAMAPQIRGWLSQDVGVPFLRPDRLVAEFDAIVQGKKPFSWQAWRWINFQRWMAVSGVQA